MRTEIDKIVIRSKKYLHNSPSNTIDQLHSNHVWKHVDEVGDDIVDAHLNIAVLLHRDNVDGAQG
jgi:hypothetical protein